MLLSVIWPLVKEIDLSFLFLLTIMHLSKMGFNFFMSMCVIIGTVRRSYGLSLPLPLDMEGEYMGKSALIQLCV